MPNPAAAGPVWVSTLLRLASSPALAATGDPVTVLDMPVPPSELIQLAGDLHVLFTVDMKLLHLAISSPVCGLQFGSGLAPAQRGTGQRLTTQAKSAAKDMDPALLLWEGCAAIRKCRR